MKKNNQQKKSSRKDLVWIFGGLSVVAFIVGLGLLFYGMSSTIDSIEQEAVSKAPEAILASAGMSEDKDVYMSVAYYDQREDECANLYDTNQKDVLEKRQFEWESCGYYNKELEKGLVDYDLGEDKLPVFRSGSTTANRGLGGTDRWFSAVDGKSASYIGALKLEYSARGAEFSFYNDEFYPIDKAEFSKGDQVNRDGHNHLFTMNFAVPITVLMDGHEALEITADDDTFVFMDDKLAIDLGGVHDAMSGQLIIHNDGEVYAATEGEELAYTGIKLVRDAGTMLRIFHADRDAAGSVFAVRLLGMNVTLVDTKLAQKGVEDSMQVAYDPTDPTYEAPLGQSVVIKPDNTKGYIIMLTIEGAMVVVFAILLVLAAKMFLQKRYR